MLFATNAQSYSTNKNQGEEDVDCYENQFHTSAS